MSAPTRPLEGLRVLDFSHIWAGPICGRILGDLGADVIKIEGPGRYDGMRNLFLMANDTDDDYWNRSGFFQNRNQNKRGIAIDLTTEEGRDLIRGLVPHADVVVENFTPRVMPALGLGYKRLADLNPGLVMIAMSGYGAAGPYSRFGAIGLSLDGSTGLSASNGHPGDRPEKSGSAFLDPFAGVAGAAAVMAALLERERTGRGQFIDLSQHEGGINFVGGYVVEHGRSGREPERRGSRSDRFAPQGFYPCDGDEQWLYLSLRDEPGWRALCEELGVPALCEEPGFGSAAERLARHDALDARLAERTRLREKRELMAALQERGLIAAALLDGAEVLNDPHLAVRDTFESIDVGTPPRPYPSQRALPARFDGFEPRRAGPAPRLGEHNREVLGGLLGLDESQLARLETEGVIGTEPRFAIPVEQQRDIIRYPLAMWVGLGSVRWLAPDGSHGLAPGEPQPEESQPGVAGS
jgi:crotonobetainyl-CoA:carnitine CoA-transferase CaiB-like acyl-CoA transferase